MRYFTFGILFTLVLLVGCSNEVPYLKKRIKPKTPDTLKVLQKVKQHYHRYKSLEIKAKGLIHINIESEGLKRQQTTRSTMYFASLIPGKFRIVYKDNEAKDIVVSNGNILWRFYSLGNKFTEKKYGILPSESNNLSYEIKTFGSNFFMVQRVRRSLNPLADSILKISPVKRDTLLMPDSSLRKVLKVRVKYAKDSLDLKGAIGVNKSNPKIIIKNKTRLPFTFWIDPKTYNVLRESFGKSIKFTPRGKTDNAVIFAAHNDIYFTSINFHPAFNDSTFVFRLLKSAKKIKVLNGSESAFLKNRKILSAMTGKQAINFTLKSFNGKKLL